MYNGLDMKQIAKHRSLSFCQELRQLAAPFLDSHGLSVFTHRRVFSDGSQYILPVYAELALDYYQHGLDNLMEFQRHLRPIPTGWHLAVAATEIEQEFLKHMRDNHNIGNGIVLVKNYADYQDQFHFSSRPDNFAINDFYVNNLNLLYQFADYYLERFNREIARCDEHRIYLPNRNAHTTGIAPLYGEEFSHQPYGKLSAQEYFCVKYTAAGLTTKETAQTLDLSPRTVEHYLGNARKKYQCQNTASLILKLKEFIQEPYDFTLEEA